jgi:hypothetical protein
MKRTRISKQPRFRHESCAHRIEFDVSNDRSSLLGRPHSPIIGFILPKRSTSSAQEIVSLPRGDSLNILSYSRSGSPRIDQEMDVIRHHNKSDEVVPPIDPIAILDDSSNTLGNRRLFKPVGTTVGSFQFAIGCNKCAPVTATMQREHAVQPERYEKRCSVGLEVGKLAAVLHMTVVQRIGKDLRFFAQAKAYPGCRSFQISRRCLQISARY